MNWNDAVASLVSEGYVPRTATELRVLGDVVADTRPTGMTLTSESIDHYVRRAAIAGGGPVIVGSIIMLDAELSPANGLAVARAIITRAGVAGWARFRNIERTTGYLLYVIESNDDAESGYRSERFTPAASRGDVWDSNGRTL